MELVLLFITDGSGPETQSTGQTGRGSAEQTGSAEHLLPGLVRDAAAAGLLIIRRGMKVLLLWFSAGAAEEVPDALLPLRRGPRKHRVTPRVLALS